MSDQENLAAQNNLESDDTKKIREKFDEVTQAAQLTPEQNLHNAQALATLRTMLTMPMNTALSALCSDLDRIIDSADHARSTLPASPNAADVGVSMVVKLAGIAKNIKENVVPQIVGSCGSTASIVGLALEQAQSSSVQACQSAISAHAVNLRIHEIGDQCQSLSGRSDRLEAIVLRIAEKLGIETEEIKNAISDSPTDAAGDTQPIPLNLDDHGTPATGASTENSPNTTLAEPETGGEPAAETTPQA